MTLFLGRALPFGPLKCRGLQLSRRLRRMIRSDHLRCGSIPPEITLTVRIIFAGPPELPVPGTACMAQQPTTSEADSVF
jgi:hypothetical protein